MCEEMPVTTSCAAAGDGLACLCWTLGLLALLAVNGLIFRVYVTHSVVLFLRPIWKDTRQRIAFKRAT